MKPQTPEEWEALLASEGMPDELAPIPRPGVVREDPRYGGFEQNLEILDGAPVARVRGPGAETFFSSYRATLLRPDLTGDDRKILESYVAGRGTPTIAAAMGLPRTTLRWRLFKILARFNLKPYPYFHRR